ncbi:MAG: hypothetical protein QM724_12560 [Flavobacteriales bacterium]
MTIYTGCTAPFTEVACDRNGSGMPAIALACQTPGATLYIRIWKESGAAARVNFSICAVNPGASPVANDEPCNAANLPVNASCSNTTGSVANATLTAVPPATSCGVSVGNDLWYQVTIPPSGSVTVTTTAGSGSTGLQDAAMAIYTSDSPPFTEVACDRNGSGMPAVTVTCQTPGDVLYIRLWKESGTATRVNFSICAVDPGLSPTTNDEPCSATVLTVGATCSYTTSTTVCATATSGISPPGCGAYTGGDVWFSLVVPASGSVTVTSATATGSTLTTASMAAYLAINCSTPGSFSLGDCRSGMGALPLTCLPAGSTIYIRVWANSNAQAGPFRICAVDPGASPVVNDEPCNATNLPVNASCSNTTVNLTNATLSASPPATSCSVSVTSDVWYKVTVPTGGSLTITTTAGSGSSGVQDAAMTIYTGYSAPFTEVACNRNGTGMPAITLTCQTPGDVLYIRLWKESGTAARVSFSICAVDAGMNAATNDEPCSATLLTVGTSCSNTTGTNRCATSSPGFIVPSCANYTGGDVWFKFVAPTSGLVAITTSTVSGSSFTDSGISLYSAVNCNVPYSFFELGCDDNGGSGNMSSLSMGCLVSGDTYYIRVWEPGNNAIGLFNICVTSGSFTGSPPSNDEPCGATLLTVGTTCTNTSSTNVNARPSCGPPAPSCGWATTNSRDVWFKFVAPASGIALINSTTITGGLTDGQMALYAAPSCSGPFTLLGCDADDGPGAMPFLARTTLTPGATYYIRYWGNNGTSGTFNICVQAPALPGTTCAYAVEMFDANEDGWGDHASRPASTEQHIRTPPSHRADTNSCCSG